MKKLNTYNSPKKLYHKSYILDNTNYINIIDNLKKQKKYMPDLQIKEITLNKDKIYIINIQTISSSKLSNEYILDYLSKRNLIKKNNLNIKNDLINNIPSISIINIKNNEIYDYLFNGFTIIIYKKDILSFETKASLDRGINIPTSEPTIKGPKDSFNENYNTNIGLIRKRIKDKNLYIEELTLGTKTNTKVCLLYLNKIVDKKLINYTKKTLNKIKTEKILDSYYIKELIKKENNTTFPTIRSTEKPDTVAKSLTEGRICILTENSNNILIIPTFFLDYFSNNEDNFQKKIYVYFSKVLRILALFITIFFPSIYLSLITYDQQMLPTDLLINFSLQRYNVPFPAIVETLLLMLSFEIIYEADALTPSQRGTSLSILGALVLGDAAVNAGIISPIMVIVVAITAISSIFFIYYDFQSFIRKYRYFLMILSSFFGVIGILFGFIYLITNLCNLTSFNKPFLMDISPIIKKNKKELISSSLLTTNTNKGEL